jgi:transcriptional regulator with XRE-family HTH domain
MPRVRKPRLPSMSSSDVAQAIQALRAEAGLTQQELADQVGTTTSVICRLENARYEGHSVAMLRRIAAALNKSVEIRFVPAIARADRA